MGSHRRSSDRKDSHRSHGPHRSRGRSRSYDRYSYHEDDDDYYRPRRPSRQGSSSTSRSAPPPQIQNPWAGLLGAVSEEPEHMDDKRGSAPPSYDESQAVAGSSDPETVKEPGKEKKRTLKSWWSLAPVLPLLTGVLLLFIITCSSSDLRADFGVIKIQLPSADYSALYSATIGQGDPAKDTPRRSIGMTRRDEAGYLTLGIWGWCVRSADSSQTACSHAAGWYSMDDLFAGVQNTGIVADNFNGFFIHLLILHGLAFLVALLACVPVGLSAWRRYRKNDAHSQPGWFQHGTILAAAGLALVAWIIDKFLKHGVASNAEDYTVESSLGAYFVGGAALSLFLAFTFSSIPLMCQFIRNKHQWAASHSELQNATVLEEEERVKREEEEKEEEEAKQKRREERRERERERERDRRDRRRDRRDRWWGRSRR